MKRFLLLALCALIALNADARTIYVDAKRPNNKGNGLSARKAKKTIQAAINVARKGDTILVLPGDYAAPLKTSNKKVTIKSTGGASKTSIWNKAKPDRNTFVIAVDCKGGTASRFQGFFFRCMLGNYNTYAAKGGTFANCSFEYFGHAYSRAHSGSAFDKAKLADCVLNYCGDNTATQPLLRSCTLNRCRIWYHSGSMKSSKLFNCLFWDGNDSKTKLTSCTLVNCTVADNAAFKLSSCKAYNSILKGVSASTKKNKLKNCFKGSDPKSVGYTEVPVPDDDPYYIPGWGASKTISDYHLTEDSPCIDAGRLTKKQKKLVGTKDLDGRKRICGKAVDMGCYESYSWIQLDSNGADLGDEKVWNGALGKFDRKTGILLLACGEAATLPQNPFVKWGSTFAGWATTPGGAVQYADKASVKNLAAEGRTVTLYAIWRRTTD